jgi:ferredoxin-NADP reductase
VQFFPLYARLIECQSDIRIYAIIYDILYCIEIGMGSYGRRWPLGKSRMFLRVQSMSDAALGIKRFTLTDADGRALPSFEPGAHIELGLPNDMRRQYSLSNDPGGDRTRYEIAVLREPNGRGGSKYLHDAVRVGETIESSAPRNNFQLVRDASTHLMIAGGIGITPFMSMLPVLRRARAAFRLVYCSRDEERTAFRQEVAPYVTNGDAVFHFDGGDLARSMSFSELLLNHDRDTHLYYCGPAGFMTAVKTASAHWPERNVHREYFSASEEALNAQRQGGSFRIKIGSTGQELDVPADKTIVQVLRAAGHKVETSCESGYCGSCITGYTDGEPDHRDDFLDAEGRKQFIMVCCSRAKSPLIVLNL